MAAPSLIAHRNLEPNIAWERVDRCKACRETFVRQTGRFQFLCRRGHTTVSLRPRRIVV